MNPALSPTVLWITDPWETLDYPTDTTLRLIEAFQNQGADNYWCDSRDLTLQQETLKVHAQQIRLREKSNRTQRGFTKKPQVFYLKRGEVSPFDQIHYRVDPPVNLNYLIPLQLLTFALESKADSVIINPASVLLQKGEKLESCVFKTASPQSVVTCRRDELMAFLKWHKQAVLKPLNLAQSKGVEMLDVSSPEGLVLAKRDLERETQNFTLPVILQEYLHEIADGEVRLWFLDGELLGVAKKHPLKGDFRVNIDRGSEVKTAELSDRQQALADEIATHLMDLGIRLAAIDIIGAKVTDYNFTSPGLIVQMEKVLKKPLADQIAQALCRG